MGIAILLLILALLLGGVGLSVEALPWELLIRAVTGDRGRGTQA